MNNMKKRIKERQDKPISDYESRRTELATKECLDGNMVSLQKQLERLSKFATQYESENQFGEFAENIITRAEYIIMRRKIELSPAVKRAVHIAIADAVKELCPKIASDIKTDLDEVRECIGVWGNIAFKTIEKIAKKVRDHENES
jgi:hypothetical protein